MEGLLGILFFGYIVYLVLSPADTSSTSYRMGRGIGSKTKKVGKWLMDD